MGGGDGGVGYYCYICTRMQKSVLTILYFYIFMKTRNLGGSVGDEVLQLTLFLRPDRRAKCETGR